MDRDIDQMAEFSDWLKVELTRRHWTQAELARKLDTSPSSLWNALKGGRGVGYDLATRIAHVLGESQSEVLMRAGLLTDDDAADKGELSAATAADLERLKRRLARMSAAQRERYLALFEQMIEAGEMGRDYDSAGKGS